MSRVGLPRGWHVLRGAEMLVAAADRLWSASTIQPVPRRSLAIGGVVREFGLTRLVGPLLQMESWLKPSNPTLTRRRQLHISSATVT